MAVDEALLLDGSAPPTLRFYTWSPAALSLGYFQRWTDVPAAERAGTVVRRLTGGGAIHHARELTFSFTAREDHALYRGPVRESYERIHTAIAKVLSEFGVDARLRGENSVQSDVDATGMCFHKSTDLDLIWDRGKGLGSAQRRTGGRVLHHGSIKIGSSDLEPGISTLDSSAPSLAAEELAERLIARFPDLLDLEFAAGELSSNEIAGSRARADHFSSPEFLHRR
ncbi:MAG: lipoate-protein ligase A [Planctomycetota bacterium]|jgi:lipoate-protein ligase A